MRTYRILKVAESGDDAWVAVVARDYQDDDAWAVIERFPGTPAGLERARAYVLDVQTRQDDLRGDR